MAPVILLEVAGSQMVLVVTTAPVIMLVVAFNLMVLEVTTAQVGNAGCLLERVSKARHKKV
jgi:hypothetical protein